MSPLSGKTALVTGASRGIGRASALALAHAGAQVLVHYCHEDQAANEVVAQIRSAGGRAGARGNRGWSRGRARDADVHADRAARGHRRHRGFSGLG
jgi:NAD(P)-dependent dehydrogenase (short-subunit alcohol dehydrogenase family)